MKLKLRSSVSVVDRKDNIIEFFKTNTREQVLIRSFHPILKSIISEMDGTFTLDELIDKNSLEEIKHELSNFIEFLHNKGILSNTIETDMKDYKKYRRVIHFIEDYSKSSAHLNEMWKNIRNGRVVIIGLGAVGTWVAVNLVQSGVQNLTLIDNDVVDITNLHRQFGYSETDIGKYKSEVLKNKLIHMNSNLHIEIVPEFLDGNLLNRVDLDNIDLIINCADTPNVDTTSLWVGEYCMDKNIPHIVGGGYNMHLSLVGQTVIPNESACVKCFEIQLKELNKIDPKSVKKLVVKNRKIGSFGPMCAIIASFVGMEALKILTKHIKPANVNRRGEFNVYDMDIKYKEFTRVANCPWCGKG